MQLDREAVDSGRVVDLTAWKTDRAYLTKGGHKAVMYRVWPSQDAPIHGAVFFRGSWMTCAWTLAGDSTFMEPWDLTTREAE